MVDGSVDKYGLEWHCFTQICLPSASTLRALLLKAVLLQPPTIPQKTETKPKLVHETNADVEGNVVLKEAIKKENPSIASRPKNKSEGSQALLEKEVSAQLLLWAKEDRLRVQDATKKRL
ncbi:hypothetical protein ALT721_1130001 [Alteromonas alvinellae]